MSTKLDWVYQDRSGEYHAEYKDLVIRAIHDSDARNPFEEDDGHWPMAVLTDSRNDKPTIHDKITGAGPLCAPNRFSAAQLVHDQITIGKIVKVCAADFESHLEPGQKMRKYWTDVGLLQLAFEDAWEDLSHSQQFEAAVELYKLLGIPCLRTTVHGYSQGDWADLLIVATPEAVKAHMGDDYFAEICDPLWDVDGAGFRVGARDVTSDRCATIGEASAQFKERWVAKIGEDLENQAKLYKAWAFGDVYGYQIARKVTTTHCCDCDHVHEGEVAACPGCKGNDIYEETELQDLDGDSSCWGYYGSDFDWSGLEDAAIEAADGFVEEKVDG